MDLNIIKTYFSYKEPLIPLNLKKIDYIVLHHLKAFNATPEEIHRWHLNRSFNGFGYGEYIRKDGTVYIGRGYNVQAQCKGYNSISYGIALEGNWEIEDEMPLYQMRSLLKRLRHHKSKFPNKVSIVGHGDLYPSACPGKNFPMQDIIKRVDENNHWSNGIYEELITEYGLTIHEKRFDDGITRGENNAMILQALNSIKNYIDNDNATILQALERIKSYVNNNR